MLSYFFVVVLEAEEGTISVTTVNSLEVAFHEHVLKVLMLLLARVEQEACLRLEVLNAEVGGQNVFG